MSRLIIKNLPAYLDDARLKDHLSSHGGTVTDSKIIRRSDGTSRRFGFVGFKSDVEAQEALRYFHRTFIDTARIDVGLAKAFEGEGNVKEKKVQQSGPAVIEIAKAQKPELSKTSDIAKSKKPKRMKSVSFDEFMAVMAPKKKRKVWQNEEGEDGDGRLRSSDFETTTTPSEKKVKKQKREETGVDQIIEQISEKEGSAHDETLHDEGLTDLDYMYKRMKRKVGEDLEESEKKFEQSDSDAESDTNNKDSDEESIDEEQAEGQERERRELEEKARKDQENVDAIMSSGRLFVRNLPFDATEEDLEDFFSRYGEVTQAHITLDKLTKKSKGIAFITFASPSHALAAFRSTDGSTFQGRLLHIIPAVQLKQNETAALSVRDKKKQELKANASKDFNWSTLFMSSDAVASSVAGRLGISKSDIVNPEEDPESKDISPAVRLALAETSVIQETKEYLEGEGINVNAFQGSDLRRSDTTTLVKNIPYGTSQETLRGLFEKFGNIERVVMPPSGTIAIVEMAVSGESKVAFKALAYKRLGNSILYLEKAPMGIMSGPPRKDVPATSTEHTSATVATIPGDESNEADATATLFVKNLAFSTSDERLQSLFGHLNDFLFARIQRRPSKNGVAKLSMGYGFIGFKSTAAARAAQRAMDKTTLDGHLLSVTFAKRGHDADDENTGTKSSGTSSTAVQGAPTSKLIIKNLPFQASKKDVRALFGPHGKLKSVRVPRKNAAGTAGGGSAAGVRGFGFVEFVNRKEAENAYNSLKHTHLLGRHLILEWDVQSVGSSEAQVEALRKKTARGLIDVGLRKEKLHLNEEDIRAAAKKDKDATEEEDEDEDDDGGV